MNFTIFIQWNASQQLKEIGYRYTQQHNKSHKHHAEQKKQNHKRIHTVLIHFYEIAECVALIYSDTAR